MPDALSGASSVISAERKRSLLLEARRDRVAWVDAASVPFRSALDGPGDVATRDIFRHGDDGLQVLRSARACASMSSTVEVLKTLYFSPPKVASVRGSDSDTTERKMCTSSQDAADRIKWLLESDTSSIRADDLQMAMMSTKSSRKVRVESAALDTGEDKVEERQEDQQKGVSEVVNQYYDNKDFIAAYCAFLHKLRTPECAELVQALRRFVNSFEDFARGAADRKKGVTGDINGDDDKRMAKMVQEYISKSLDAFKSHPKWGFQVGNSEEDGTKEGTTTSELPSVDLKQSINTFIFAKCHESVWSYLTDDDAVSQDSAFQSRLHDLQFITPKHLDIHCLAEIGNGNLSEHDKPEKTNRVVTNVGGVLWSKQLSTPIRALQSVERQYSPSRMLACIHDVYRGINKALSTAMENIDTEKSGNALPSADDVLPALILVVLRAQPRHIVSNLNFIDLFATPEQLRGEAGYAFTNLFSAVQFLRDLDIDKYLEKRDDADDDSNRMVSFFSMSPDEFRSGLEKCRKEAHHRAAVKLLFESAGEQTGEKSASLALAELDLNIPVCDIHSARSRGEIVDMEWARNWQNRNLDSAGVKVPLSDSSKQQDQTDAPPPEPLPLPDGFSRSYNFLSVAPDDVRISDVPQLLHEYQMLVRATECLLSERNAKFSADHKKRARITRDKLESAVKEVDE
uniref:VPS9 domain-containing protein n=1 Tax=Odontella aurita TaxID=265563 RepID=A0A7S4JWA8_9STRA|mmetsp:Transcript_55792/g.167198  ORF Transcript_55792/g.167198 Transcript_55792/m.167198 type:complete len:685 (+) Transcript_55792:300-2354(+)